MTKKEIMSIRAATGLTQYKFCKKHDFVLSTYKNWEQGRRKPNRYAIKLLMYISQKI